MLAKHDNCVFAITLYHLFLHIIRQVKNLLFRGNICQCKPTARAGCISRRRLGDTRIAAIRQDFRTQFYSTKLIRHNDVRNIGS